MVIENVKLLIFKVLISFIISFIDKLAFIDVDENVLIVLEDHFFTFSYYFLKCRYIFFSQNFITTFTTFLKLMCIISWLVLTYF